MTPEAQRIAIAEGVKIGRLTAVKFSRRANRMAVWLWLCDCGCQKEILASSVSTRHTLSCGCLRREVTARTKTTHGNARRKRHSREYRIWRGMISRCTLPNNPAYPDYGGRGIGVCQRWLNSFQAFLEDMGKCPAGHSIERTQNHVGYFPHNCVWATAKEQSNNRRNRRWKKKP
jgi:hypothetical protein